MTPYKVGILDTGIATENTGDLIIMESARREIEEIFYDKQLIFFPTHEKLSKHSHKLQKLIEYNLACGTNLLHSHMGFVKQWNIGLIDAFKIKPVILLGVGWRSQKKRETDIYTKWLLRRTLSKDFIHSARDSYSLEKIKNAGIENVINTGCPTTWKLDEEHCKKIPSQRGENAILVLTDYSQNKKLDTHLINTATGAYKKIYFWSQGTHDHEYLNALGFASKFEIIPPSLNAYRKILADETISLDYIGTRLHGGIFALQHKRRSLIIGVDHRATKMATDINLPVLDRYVNKECIEERIFEPYKTDITLPKENIEIWRSQFKKHPEE